MPPATVPAVGRVAEKWARRVAGATTDYDAGITAAGGKWAAAAKAADMNYRTAVTAAAGAGRFAKGVERAGDAKWSRGAKDKGVQRYGPGAQAAQGDFSTAIAPVLEVIGRTDLPARGPRGQESNYARSAAIGKALRAFATGR
jgi:hypothetical protein